MGYLIIIAVWLGSTAFVHYTFDSILSTVYIALSPFLLLFVCFVYKSGRCPHCKKFGLNEISRRPVKYRNTTKPIVKERYNHRTGCYESYTEKVPATETTYEVIKQCQYCGYVTKPKYEREID